MAGLTCIYCHADNAEGEQLCRACFRRLPAAPAAAPEPAHAEQVIPESATAQPRQPDLPDEIPAGCPRCGAEVPDPGNRVCVECHLPLTRAEPMRLSFPSGAVTVDAAQDVPLGRDPASSPVAELFADRGNVSRLHATVGVDADGAWVRDERSLNGTYVNDVPVAPGSRIRLADGDTLRLAADVTAIVRRADNLPDGQL